MPKKINDVMTKNPETCLESEQAFHAAQKMRDLNIGLLPITDASKKVKGVITDRDLTLRVLAEKKKGETPLGQLMSQGQLVTVNPDESLEDAEEKMMSAGKERAIVVDKDGRAVGVISISDIAREERPERAGKFVKQAKRGHVAKTSSRR